MNIAEPKNPQSVGWASVLLIYLLSVLSAASVSQVVPIVGDIARYFHAAPVQLGWIISIPSALMAVGALATGWVVDRVGDKPILLLGAALLMLGDIGVTVVASINSLLAMRVLEGLGHDLIAVSSVTMMARITQGKRRTTALTLWSSFIPMSFAVPLLLVKLLSGTGHWRWAFTGHAGLLLVLGTAALWLPKAVPGTTLARTGGLGSVLRTPACYALGVSFACAAFVQTGVVSTLPTLLSRRYGVSLELASAAGTIGMLCNIGGCVLVGRLLNSGLSTLRLAMGSVLLTALFGVGLYALPGWPVAAAVVFAWGFFLGAGLIVGLWALLPFVAPTPTSRGATSGLVQQVTLWGVLFGPPAAFAAQARVEGAYREIVNIIVALLLCAAMLYVVAHRVGTRRESLDAPSGH